MSTKASIHFVTGKLAEPSLRDVVDALSSKVGIDYTIDVLPISVAALMTPKWLMKHISIPHHCDRIILPGYLTAGLSEIRNEIQQRNPDRVLQVDCGPKDVRDLPTMFGKKRHRGEDYGNHSIEIIAEINYAPRMSLPELLTCARALIEDGADRIDLGCEPGSRWLAVSDAVKLLVDQGIKLSIDTFDAWEAETASKVGASLVLSVNESNRDAAKDWGVEVVIVPELGANYLKSMNETIDVLTRNGVPYRLDPILEPIGCGFAASLGRYMETRQEFPDAPMMMGIGNLTELTDADSAPINLLLLGICEELQIGSVLTTQVISWAKTSVRECHLARKLVSYSIRHRIPPKHLEERLVMLRDPQQTKYSATAIEQLASAIKDNNYRILIDENEIHLISANVHIRGIDPFEMMRDLMSRSESRNVDASHAFYLGFELNKALTALTLGKRYEQDEALRWGMLTREEKHQRLPRDKASKRRES